MFQAEDGIRDLVRSRGLGDVYKRQAARERRHDWPHRSRQDNIDSSDHESACAEGLGELCLLYTSDAADERSSVDLGGRRIIKKTHRCPPLARQAIDHVYACTIHEQTKR